MKIRKTKKYIGNLSLYSPFSSVYCPCCELELSIEKDLIADLIYRSDPVHKSGRAYRLRCPKCFTVEDFKTK